LDESTASDLIDEIEASPHKASNDFLSQYKTEVIEENSPSPDKYANGDREDERTLETPPTDLEPESYNDAEKSYKSKSAEISKPLVGKARIAFSKVYHSMIPRKAQFEVFMRLIRIIEQRLRPTAFKLLTGMTTGFLWGVRALINITGLTADS
jgi:hypothetical protein